jgi:hypothetical protein
MRRPRSGIGAELVPLVLILAGLAGSLALIVTVHRRAIAPKAPKSAVAVALPPAPPAPKPAPIPVAVVDEPVAEEPEPPPPPAPEDPTPKVLAKLTSAEAEQLLEASRADRKAAALDQARKAAELESEKWRRRESLVRLQLDSLDAKVRKMETEVDELALERDALEKERDARKAMASKTRSRPSQAILPHRGQNGTWRRPIVIECVNGMAILRPQGFGFGLLELSSGFGPASNPFVAAVAREAIRIQGSHSPDGQAVVPYIFFLVRPDGIRPYYEARGRLEPLGITFGYELADQDWEVDFPDLDDVSTWDGSPSSRPDPLDVLARTPARAPGSSPAEDEDFPAWGAAGRPGTNLRDVGPGGEFVWPPRTRAIQGNGSVALGAPRTSTSPSGARSGLRYSNSGDNRRVVEAETTDLGEPGGGGPPAGTGPSNAVATISGPSGVGTGVGIGPGTGMGPGSGSGVPPTSAAPRELTLGDGPIRPLKPADASLAPPGSPSGPPSGGGASPAGDLASEGSGSPPAAPSGAGDSSTSPPSRSKDDPANSFVWPSPKLGTGPGGRPAQAAGTGSDPGDGSPPVRHVGPFSRPLAMGVDSSASPAAPGSTNPPAEVDPTQPDGPAGDPSNTAGQTQAGSPGGSSKVRGSTGASSAVQGIGQGGTPGVQPPPGTIGVGTPAMTPPPGMTPPSGMTPPPGMTPPSGMTPPPGQPKKPSSSAMPGLPPPAIVDRRFEIVLVCGPRGVIVQPGSYRVTTDALKDRDGLLKKEIVALVKARRTADPKTIIEPRVRFLVQPGGDQNYWTARSQFLLSGLDWPISTQVADPDHLAILPSESW